MPILHRPPPGGTELGTQQDRGTFVGRQAGILTVYATSRPAEVVIGYYRTTYPSFHFKPEDYPPSGTVSFIGSQRYAGGTANAFVRIRDGSPWIEDGYSIEPRPAPSGATTFVTVLLLGVPD